jgi:anaerobic selenocysteine-containing dehydrogenase
MDGMDLLLVSRRQHGIYNSVGHTLPALAKKVPFNPVFMNPDDAAQLGVGNGDPVQLATARAKVFGTVEVADDIRRGVVSVAHGFPNSRSVDGSDEHKGTSTAALLDDETEYDPISGLPVMSAVPVSVSVPNDLNVKGAANG